MSPNYGDNPIRRAAGVMAWKLTHGGTQQEAVAKAAAREPQLTEAQLRYALQWAHAAILCGDMLTRRDHGLTLQQLRERTGLAQLCDPANYPPDVGEVQ